MLEKRLDGAKAKKEVEGVTREDSLYIFTGAKDMENTF